MERRPPADAGTTFVRGLADLRAEPAMGIPSLLREFGVDPQGVLRSVGLAPDALDDPEQRLPYATIGRLVQACVDASGCPHFGLLLGQRSGGAVLGLAGHLALHARTVRAGLRAMIVYFYLHDRGAALVLAPRGDSAVELAYVMHRGGIPGSAQIADAAMAIGVQLLRRMCGPRWRPAEVTLAHQRPRDVAPYRQCFGAPPRFDNARTAIVFDARWLDEPVARGDAAAFAELERAAARLASDAPVALGDRVRDALAAMVIGDKPSVDRVAQHLGTTRRTLHRRLAKEGGTFHALVQQVRCHLAQLLLADTRMPLGEIAATLDYSEPAAFSRAFRHWTGTTPSAFRAAAGRQSEAPEAAAGSALSA
jgi:AraC-like DNA-binding protein